MHGQVLQRRGDGNITHGLQLVGWVEQGQAEAFNAEQQVLLQVIHRGDIATQALTQACCIVQLGATGQPLTAHLGQQHIERHTHGIALQVPGIDYRCTPALFLLVAQLIVDQGAHAQFFQPGWQAQGNAVAAANQQLVAAVKGFQAQTITRGIHAAQAQLNLAAGIQHAWQTREDWFRQLLGRRYTQVQLLLTVVEVTGEVGAGTQGEAFLHADLRQAQAELAFVAGN